MGSAHPRAAYAASQEGSGNMNKLFKKSVLSCGFEAAMKDGYTIIASTMGSAADSLRNPERLAAPPASASSPRNRLTRRSAPA
jgi:hypothetical protein